MSRDSASSSCTFPADAEEDRFLFNQMKSVWKYSQRRYGVPGSASWHPSHILCYANHCAVQPQGLMPQCPWVVILIDWALGRHDHQATISLWKMITAWTIVKQKKRAWDILTWIFPSDDPEYKYCDPVVSAGLKLHRMSVRRTWWPRYVMTLQSFGCADIFGLG